MAINVFPQDSGVFDIAFADSPSVDAFFRARFSQPETLFDSKQIFDSQPLFWDDQEVSGSGTSSTYNNNQASTTIGVSASTAGKRVRQTFQRFNYQSGKSQLYIFTFSNLATTTGIMKEVGPFTEANGLFFRSAGGIASVVQRSSVTGVPVDTVVEQADWNIDKLDGTGASKINLDFEQALIGVIDFEWLGVGRVRFGFFVEGQLVYCHQIFHSNLFPVVYISTPNLPIRYDIENDGTGAADDFTHICSTVISEGGQQSTGAQRRISTGNTFINAQTQGIIYTVCAIRQKTTALDSIVDLENVSLLALNNDDYEWILLFNPTVATPVTFTDKPNSVVQEAVGNAGSPSSSTLTGGTELAGGFVAAGGTSGNIAAAITSALKLGSAIDGTRDEVYLGCRPLSNGLDIVGSLSWREPS